MNKPTLIIFLLLFALSQNRNAVASGGPSHYGPIVVTSHLANSPSGGPSHYEPRVVITPTPTQTNKDQSMHQAFLAAAVNGDVAKVQQLLKADPTLARAKDDKGLSVILKATYFGKKDVVAALLATGVELDIFEASATGQITQVQHLLKTNPALVNTYSTDGFTPLGLAAFFGHPDTVNTLLSAGAEVNAASRESMRVTPLASATAAKQLEIARVLISHGANVNAKAENNLTPLHEAAASGLLEFASLLLERGADVNAKTIDGKTPLAYAVAQKRTEMIALLRKKGGKE